MNFSSVLIVTYGRSGSTLLQGLLNSIDGCLVRGENNNFCYGLFQAYESIVGTKQQFGRGDKSDEVTCPWYGAALLDENKFIEDARKLVFNQLNPDGLTLSCIGFKEIRYINQNIDPKKLHDYLRFLEKLFSNPAFIILTRDHNQVIESAWWQSKDSKQAKSQLDKFEKNIFAYCNNKNNTFLLDYSDMVEHSQKLVAMFEFLGAPYNQTSVEKVLTTEHSYQTKPEKNIEKNTRYAERVQYPFIQYAKVNKLPANKLKKLTITGVVVLSNDINEKYTLGAVNGGIEYKVAWNIPSPAMAKRFPGNKYAENARFKISNLKVNQDKQINIYIKDEHGNKYFIFRHMS